MELYDYQQKIIDDTACTNKVAYYLEAGCGKTLLGSTKACSLGVKTLIVAPKSVIPQWIEHYKQQHNIDIYDLSKPKQLKAFISDTNSTGIITYGLVWRRTELKELKGFTLMLDESHNVCNPTSKQTKGIMKLKYENLILLSGTPNGGAYEKLYTQMKMLGYKPNKKQFEYRYCNMFDMGIGGVKFRVLSKTNPYKNIDELIHILKDELHCVFMKTEDVLTLPKQNFINCKIAVTKAYKDFIKNEYVDLGEKEYVADTSTNKLLYSRYLCGVDNPNKVDYLKTLLDGIADKVIIFYNFEDELKLLQSICRTMKIKSFIVNGAIKQVSEFKDFVGQSILLCQYQAGATGLNLQFCNKIIYFSLPLSSNLFEQSKARTWRNGQKQTCTYWLLTSGVECDILKSLNNKQDFNVKMFKG